MKKMQKRTLTVCTILCALGVLLSLPPVRADQAVVVGVNQYPNLPDSNLTGCVNDAQSMKTVLAKRGFQVTLLTDDQATKQGILQALQAAAASVKPTEQFAFYFAGHGTTGKDKTSNLLPSDALPHSEDNDISAKDLYAQVSAIPAKNRTVLLDSCFSAGMMRSARDFSLDHHAFHTRVYLRGSSRDLVLVNKRNVNQDVGGTTDKTPVCYFTASRENEQSGEDSIDGQPQGVFTHYLTTQLAAKNASWGDVQKGVAAKVAAYTQDEQHPTLSPGYEGAPVLGAKNQGSVPASGQSAATSLWDAYNADHPNPFHVLVTMNPDRTTIHVNKDPDNPTDPVNFTVNVGVEGYLLILEHGVSGNVNLLFPTSRDAAASHVTASQVVNIPSDSTKAYAPDMQGTERVKVLLFSSKAAAQALLSKMPDSLSLPYSQLQTQGAIARVPAKFDTSDITFEVVP